MARAEMGMPMMPMSSMMMPTMPSAGPQTASVTPPRLPGGPVRPADPWVSIRSDVMAGRFEAAIRTAEGSMVNPDRIQAAVLAQAYAGNAKAVRDMNAMEAAAQAIRAGRLYLDPANRPEDAIAPLQLAVEINSGDMDAQMLLGTAKARAADGYYRSGLVAFQRQDLDGAITAWDKALAIQPDHKNAQLNRAQAIELKENLQKLTK
jgi:tetratricopeptide (TPR) repeat protein